MLDEILADCLDALAKGATIRDCLSRYPAEAAALEPLLRLAVALAREGQSRLSPGAFEAGRRRLATAARARQPQSNHQAEIHHRQPRRPPTVAPQRRPPFPPYQQNGRPLPPQPMTAKPAQWQIRMLRSLRVALVLLTLVSAMSFVRQAATSLPGTWLYPVKSSGERMVGVLMTAAGEETRWRANQLERRLQEVDGLTVAGATPVQRATAALESDWQELLTASAALSADERVALIAAQIARFQHFERSWASRQGAAPQVAVVTLRKLIAAGEAAVTMPTPFEAAPTVAVTATALAPTTMPTMTPTALDTATPTVTPTALLQPSATALGVPILEPSPTPLPSPTVAPAPATPVAPTPTSLPTPLPEITVAEIPRQETSNQETEKQKDEEAAASGAEAPTATPDPLLPVATADIATVTPVIGTGPEEELPAPTTLSTEAAPTPTSAAEPPTVTSDEGALSPTKPLPLATATPEPAATNTARPTNQPSATKTPKVTATQANSEPTTPNAPTVAPGTTVAQSTPGEKTPNATPQSVATKEAATETPATASLPTVRITSASGDATKTPQP